jgi:hypothetical protein
MGDAPCEKGRSRIRYWQEGRRNLALRQVSSIVQKSLLEGRKQYISALLFTFMNAGSTGATARSNNHTPNSHFILACRSASLSPSSPAGEPLEPGVLEWPGSSRLFAIDVEATRAGAFPRCGVPMGVCTAEWTG